jgi:hypothetical protein
MIIMVWVLIGLGLIVLIVVSSKFPSVNKNTNLSAFESAEEISTVNTALVEYLNSFNVYVVKLVYFIDGEENVIRENVYDTDTNETRLERAERFYNLTYQNILTQHEMNAMPTENQFLISLSLIENCRGIEKVTIIKQADNESLKSGL